MKLSIVTTIYRSADAIIEFHRLAAEAARELGAEAEIIFVNDASPDRGLDVARELAGREANVVVIDLARNVGQHRALWVGLQRATGDLVAVLDGDLDESPLWLVTFRAKMRETGADVVYGVSNAPSRGPLYAAGRGLFYALYGGLASHAAPRNMTTARLMTRRYVDGLLRYEERELALFGIMASVGFLQVGVEVDKSARSPTTYSLPALIAVFIRGVTSFSIVPLLGIFFVGLAVFAISLAFIGVVIAQRLFFQVGVEGWTSVMAVLLFLGGLVLLFNGVIAIYVGTIFLEVKRRPGAIVREVFSGSGEAQRGLRAEGRTRDPVQ